MTPKLVDNRNASKCHAEKMKVDSLYEETLNQFFDLSQSKIAKIQPQKAKNDPKLGYQ